MKDLWSSLHIQFLSKYTMGDPSNELFAKLQHRDAVNQGIKAPQQKERVSKNVYMEFTEFTRKQIKELEKKFKQFCSPETQIIGLTELKVNIS